MISNLHKLLFDADNMDDFPSSPVITSNPPSDSIVDNGLKPTDKRKVTSSELGVHEPSSEESSKRRMLRRVSTNVEEEDQGQDLEVDTSQAVPQETNNDLKARDYFLYFSSDKNRLEYLLGKDLPSMPQEDPKNLKRKKRISFELDPLFDMTESFPELYDEALDMNDDEDLDKLLDEMLDQMWESCIYDISSQVECTY